MPISTTFVITRSFGLSVPASRLSSRSAQKSWPTISEVFRLRAKPCLPVEQKRQPIAQPACVEMQSVPRSTSGIYTASTALPLPTSKAHLRVPSEEICSRIGSGGRTSAIASSFSRKDFARFVILLKSLSRLRWIHRVSWTARKGFSPRLSHHLVSCSRSKSRRFTRSAAIRHLPPRPVGPMNQ